MPSHLILTVGISLLTNFAKARNLALDEAAKLHQAIADFLHTDPRKACAEINSLDSRTGFLSGQAPGLAVTLAFTAAEKGKLCSSLIEKELKGRKVQVHKLPCAASMLPRVIWMSSTRRGNAPCRCRTSASGFLLTSCGLSKENPNCASN